MAGRPLIALLTDFGTADTWVGQLHAAAHAVCPHARVVDLTHAVPAHDVRAGAFLLWRTAAHLPAGAITVAVVDPGVGSERDVIALRAGSQLFVGPDNGLFGWLRADFPGADRSCSIEGAVSVREPRYLGPARSATFHGRDIMVPAAAHLACGVALAALGPARERAPEGCDGLWPEVTDSEDGQRRLRGRVLHVDRFGNAWTNLPGSLVEATRGWSLRAGDHLLSGPARTFSDVVPGAPLAYLGSAGVVEIAVNRGRADTQLGIRCGTPVALTCRRSEPPSSG